MFKYIAFAAAMLGVFPVVGVLSLDKRLTRLAILGLIIPLINFNGTALNFMSMEWYRGTARGMEISLCYIAALIIILTVAILGGIKPQLPYTGTLLFGLYFLFSLFSLRHSGDRIISFFEIWKMMMMYLVFFAVSSYMEYTDGDFDILDYGMGIFIVLNFFLVVKQHYLGNGIVRGFFPHKNSMAMFMVLAIMIQFSLFFNTRGGKKAWQFLFFFCCGAASTLRTYSRGGFVSLPIAIIICLFLSLFLQFKVRKVHYLLLIVFIGIIGFLIFLPKIILRFETAAENSGVTRSQFVTIAMNIISDNKVFGVGINNWSRTLSTTPDYKIDRETGESMYLINSGIVETIYLLVAAECGIPCLVALLLWFFYYFFLSIKLAYCLRKTKYFYFPVASAGGLFAVYLQSALEWVLKQSMNFMLLMIVFAMLSYLDRHYKHLIKKEEEAAKQQDSSEDNEAAEDMPQRVSEPAIQ